MRLVWQLAKAASAMHTGYHRAREAVMNNKADGFHMPLWQKIMLPFVFMWDARNMMRGKGAVI